MKNTDRKLVASGLPFKRIGTLSLAIDSLAIFVSLLFQNNLPPEIPLFYGKPRGNEQLLPKIYLVLPPATALIATMVNVGVAKIIKDKFLQKLLTSTVAVTSVMAAFAVYKTLSLVGNF